MLNIFTPIGFIYDPGLEIFCIKSELPLWIFMAFIWFIWSPIEYFDPWNDVFWGCMSMTLLPLPVCLLKTYFKFWLSYDSFETVLKSVRMSVFQLFRISWNGSYKHSSIIYWKWGPTDDKLWLGKFINPARSLFVSLSTTRLVNCTTPTMNHLGLPNII